MLRDRGESLTDCLQGGRQIVKLDRRVVVGARAESRLCASPRANRTKSTMTPENIAEGLRTLGDTNYETRDDFSDVRLKRRLFAHSVTRLRLAGSRAIDTARHRSRISHHILFTISLPRSTGIIVTSGRLSKRVPAIRACRDISSLKRDNRSDVRNFTRYIFKTINHRRRSLGVIKGDKLDGARCLCSNSVAIVPNNSRQEKTRKSNKERRGDG